MFSGVNDYIGIITRFEDICMLIIGAESCKE